MHNTVKAPLKSF